MHSFYVLHRSDMVANNGDTISKIFVLSDRNDLLRAFEELGVGDTDDDGYGADVLQLRVYQSGRLVSAQDLRSGHDRLGDHHDAVEPVIPSLQGTPLPPGHPVWIDGEPIAYGYTTR